jgi:uncharacterized protein
MESVKMIGIHIEQIKEDGLALEFEEPAQTFPVLAEMAEKGECEFQAPVKANLKAQRIRDMVEVEGEIETSVRLPCSRCLQLFEIKIKSIFELTFTPQTTDIIDEQEIQEVELNAEDMGLVNFQGDRINLKNTIQEQVVMEFPLKALCRPGCKGLCAKCGTDLNVAPCDCDRMLTTGKFAALKNLNLEK